MRPPQSSPLIAAMASARAFGLSALMTASSRSMKIASARPCAAFSRKRGDVAGRAFQPLHAGVECGENIGRRHPREIVDMEAETGIRKQLAKSREQPVDMRGIFHPQRAGEIEAADAAVMQAPHHGDDVIFR